MCDHRRCTGASRPAETLPWTIATSFTDRRLEPTDIALVFCDTRCESVDVFSFSDLWQLVHTHPVLDCLDNEWHGNSANRLWLWCGIVVGDDLCGYTRRTGEWTVFAVRSVQERITVGMDAKQHMARYGTWVRGELDCKDLHLDSDPFESLVTLMTLGAV